MTDSENYGLCQLLHKTLVTIGRYSNEMDRELIHAMVTATNEIPVYLQAPSQENREMVIFSIKKFDQEFGGLQHSFLMGKSLAVSIEQFNKRMRS